MPSCCFRVAEIAVFLLVAALIGFLGAFTLMLATTLAGVVVLRQAGRGRIAQFRVAVSDAEITGIEANTAGFLTVLAGLLLVLPGFLTDLVGVGAADRSGAPLVRPQRSSGRWVGRRQDARTRRDRSRAGRMAAGARPRAIENRSRKPPLALGFGVVAGRGVFLVRVRTAC